MLAKSKCVTPWSNAVKSMSCAFLWNAASSVCRPLSVPAVPKLCQQPRLTAGSSRPERPQRRNHSAVFA